MSADSPPQRRHALGLPAGSIRALLGLGVLGMLWLLALTSRSHQLPEVFTYLMLLMILILAHYFAAHGKTVGRAVSERSAVHRMSMTARSSSPRLRTLRILPVVEHAPSSPAADHLDLIADLQGVEPRHGVSVAQFDAAR